MSSFQGFGAAGSFPCFCGPCSRESFGSEIRSKCLGNAASQPQWYGNAASQHQWYGNTASQPQWYGNAASQPQSYGNATPSQWPGSATPSQWPGSATPSQWPGSATPSQWPGSATPSQGPRKMVPCVSHQSSVRSTNSLQQRQAFQEESRKALLKQLEEEEMKLVRSGKPPRMASFHRKNQIRALKKQGEE